MPTTSHSHLQATVKFFLDGFFGRFREFRLPESAPEIVWKIFDHPHFAQVFLTNLHCEADDKHFRDLVAFLRPMAHVPGSRQVGSSILDEVFTSERGGGIHENVQKNHQEKI